MNAPSIALTDSSAPRTLELARVLVRGLILDHPGPPAVLDEPAVVMAFTEELAPWLGARVGAGHVAVPEAWRERLAWEHQMCLAASAVRVHATRAFVARCRQAAIPLAWLKGMALVPEIIGPGLRSMVDMDVLVPAARWAEACRFAAELPGVKELHSPGRRYTEAHDYVRAFSSPSGVTIEVHRHVCESSLFDIDYDGPDGLFAHTAPPVSGVSALAEGDLFLTLAAHAAKHTFELPLRSFLDGIVLLQRRRFELERLAERARRWRMDRALRLWLQGLHALAPFLALPTELATAPLSPIARAIWARTRDVSAWQRFVRLAWIADRPEDWARHVLTRIALRARDVVEG